MASVPLPASDHAAVSAAVRLHFERWATKIPIATVAALLVVLLVALFLPKGTGEVLIARVLQIKDAVIELLGTLGGFLGLSWGRGHMDRRLDGGGS